MVGLDGAGGGGGGEPTPGESVYLKILRHCRTLFHILVGGTRGLCFYRKFNLKIQFNITPFPLLMMVATAMMFAGFLQLNTAVSCRF